MLRIAVLLIIVPLALLIFYVMKKALQHSDTDDTLEKIKHTEEELNLLKTIDLEQVKQQRSEVDRIKKELQ